MYGLAARAVRISADGLTYRFPLRPEARFHDGSRLTAHDVAFSLTIAEGEGPSDHHAAAARFRRRRGGGRRAPSIVRFAPKRARDVPLFVAGLPIFSRAYYAKRPFDESTLDVPLGCGPYKVGRFEAGRYIEYRARARTGGAPICRWRAARTISTSCATNTTATATSASRASPPRAICSARSSPRASGRRATTSRRSRTAASSARCCPTTRRPARRAGSSTRGGRNSSNPKLREALIYAFDFEWTNKTIMYGSYERTHSVFQNSDMMAKGKPGAEELALLEPFRGKVPDEVFGEPFVPPVSDGSGQDRALLRRARSSCRRPATSSRTASASTPQGERVTIEFLIDEPSFQPHHMPFIKNLGDARHRRQAAHRRSGADAAAPQRFRFRHHRSSASASRRRRAIRCAPISPSQAAATEGLAKSRRHRRSGDRRHDRPHHRRRNRAPALTTACRALDRLIRAGRYWIPHWYKASHWIAYWDMFGRPPTKPRYARGVLETWWYDRDKAAKMSSIPARIGCETA